MSDRKENDTPPTLTEFSKIVSERWKSMDEETRKVYYPF